MAVQPDRTLAPEIKTAPYIPVRYPDLYLPSGDAPFSFVSWQNSRHPYIRLQLIFPFSDFNHPNRLVPDFCMKMMNDGTTSRTWQELADAFDFYGTSLSGSSSDQYTEFNICYLHRFQTPILELLGDIFLNSVFPEDQLERLRQKEILSFKTKLEKVSVLSSRKLHELVFRATPYSKVIEIDNYEKISRPDILAFYNEYYLNGPSMIVVTGGEEKHAQEIFNFFKSKWYHKPSQPLDVVELNPEKGIFYVHKDNALQSSIRVSLAVPFYHHPDFPMVNVLCCLLGGYFGSRLNLNIREEKGYTYGVHGNFSKLINHLHFRISTEAGTAFTMNTVNEIKKEFYRLMEPDYPDDELKNLANYMAGLKLRSVNGIFENADAWINHYQKQISQELDKKIYDTFFEAGPDELVRAARQWLHPDNLTIVVAGDTRKFES